MDNKNVWSTSDILANRNNWSLAADVELLKHLQALSEKIFTKAASTLHSLNSFENDINQTCISIANTSNKFKALSDTQFIESKVQDESPDINEPSSSQNEPPADRANENITVKLKEALENGFQVLDTQYDIIPVTGSDSEDEEPQEILLRARNPYLSRRLPHIIGSEEFTRNDNLGLIDSSSSEEEEEEEDEDEDGDTEDDEEDREEAHVDSEEENITVQKPPSPKTEFVPVRPRTEIIRVSSSDSEDSDSSIPFEEAKKQEKIISENKNMTTEKTKVNEPVQNSNSFADHLNAALKNNPRNIYNIVPPDFGDTPPPFPGKDNGVSSDEGSEDSNDIFATKKSTKHSISNTSYKSNYDNESDEDDDHPYTKETAVISQEPGAHRKPTESRKASIASKTSQHSELASNSSDVNEAPVAPLPKPKVAESNVNSINKKMASAINAELSAKLNLKSPSIKPAENLPSTRTSSKSSENHTPVETSTKPSKNNTPEKSNKPKATIDQMPSTDTRKDSKKSGLFGKLDDEVDNEDGNEDDLFSAITSKKSSSKSKKSKGLFDDDDNIDNLFSPVKSAQSSTKKSTDLFSSKSNEPTKPEKPANESPAQPPVVDLFKNSNLFASDSDSEDDIFSIIKGQKKPAADVFKTKSDSLFENNSSDSKQASIPSNDTPSNKSSSLQKEEKLPSSDVKTSPKLADSAKSNDTTVSVDVAPMSKNNLFETTSKKQTTGDLFDSDNDDDDDDDFFTKSKKTADKRTSANENASVSKTGIHSSSGISEKIVEEKSVTEISKHNRLSSSSESLHTEENSPSQVKNIVQPDKVNIFAKFQPPKLSSSSDDEDVKQEHICDDSHTSRNDENEKPSTTPSQNKDELFDVSSVQSTQGISHTISPQKDDLFGAYGDFSTIKKESKDVDDLFGESYGSRSAMYSPPKDDLSDDFLEDEDIKDSNYLSQEDEDLFDDKFGPPPFQEASFDDDMFGEKKSTNNPQEASKKSIETDATAVEDLFKTDSASVEDLFAKSADSLPSIEKFSEKSFSEKLNLNSDSVDQSRKEEMDKNESIQKLLVPNKEKINSTASIPSSKSNDGLFDKPKESGLFNFPEKNLHDNESQIFSEISVKNEKSIPVTDKIAESNNPEQIKSSEKIPTSDNFQNSTKKSDENLQNDTNKKPSPNSKIGKIATSLFENPNTEKKQGEDVQDGNLFVKAASPESTRPAPGKLAMGRGLNINVNALLPGGNWSSKMKQKQNSEQVTPDEKQVVEPEPVIVKESQNSQEKSTGLLNNVAKERPKMSGKRRPPSRQARKSRMLNDDVFGDGFGIESPQQEEKSNISNGPPKSPEKVKVEKSEKPEKTVDELFGDTEDKIDDFFGISQGKESSAKKPSDTTSNSQISNVPSSRNTSDSDLNLDITSSVNPLPSLTKSRAKPQKRSSAPKKTLDILPDISDEKIKSTERESKSVAEQSEISVDKTATSSNPSKPTQSSIKTPVAKSIFDSLDDDDDDDDLFEIVKSKKNIEEKPVKKNIEGTPPKKINEEKPVKKNIEETPPKKIIEEKSLAKAEIKVETKPAPKPIQQQSTSKPATAKSAKIDIFNDDDDDDELFGSAKMKLPANKLSKKSSLFEDNDDDDLFGNKTSALNRKTDPVVPSVKTKVSNEKPRIVKLRSETVQKDPLTGKDITGPL